MTEKNISILTKTYNEIMQLKFSYNFLISILQNPLLKEYKKLKYSFLISFSTNAYTTLSALFTTGNYSFEQLAKNNKILENEFKRTKNKINNILPDFKNKRDKIFCHFNKEKDNKSINEIYEKFNDIFEILFCFHNKCCEILGIEDSILKIYLSEDFNQIQNELYNFCNIINAGYFELKHEELLEIIERNK